MLQICVFSTIKNHVLNRFNSTQVNSKFPIGFVYFFNKKQNVGWLDLQVYFVVSFPVVRKPASELLKHRDALGPDLAQTCTMVMWWLKLKICSYFHIGRPFSPCRDTCGNPCRAGTSINIKCELKGPGLVGPDRHPFCTGQFWQSFAHTTSMRVLSLSVSRAKIKQ